MMKKVIVSLATLLAVSIFYVSCSKHAETENDQNSHSHVPKKELSEAWRRNVESVFAANKKALASNPLGKFDAVFSVNATYTNMQGAPTSVISIFPYDQELARRLPYLINYAIVARDSSGQHHVNYLIHKENVSALGLSAPKDTKDYLLLDEIGNFVADVAGVSDLTNSHGEYGRKRQMGLTNVVGRTSNMGITLPEFVVIGYKITCPVCAFIVKEPNGIYIYCDCPICGIHLTDDPLVQMACEPTDLGGSGGWDYWEVGPDNGSDGGGGGGGVIPPGEGEGITDTDCGTFNFKKTSLANWQEAGVNKIRLRWRWSQMGGGTLMREIFINNVVVGMPTKYANGNTLSPGKAATLAAQAMQAAKILTYQHFAHTPNLTDEATVTLYYRQALHAAMVPLGGTAGIAGTGSSLITFRDEARSESPNWCE